MKRQFVSMSKALTLASGLYVAGTGSAEAGCMETPYLSTVCWTMAHYCPVGYQQANGQLIAIKDNEQLFSLLGSRFGGDGRTNFALPDLRGRTIVGAGTGAQAVTYPLGLKFGAEEVKLTADNLPEHGHSVDLSGVKVTGTVNVTGAIGDETSPVNAYPAARPSSGPLTKRIPYYGDQPVNATLAQDAVQLSANLKMIQTESKGVLPARISGIPVRPAQVSVLACIAIEGAYPDRH